MARKWVVEAFMGLRGDNKSTKIPFIDFGPGQPTFQEAGGGHIIFFLSPISGGNEAVRVHVGDVSEHFNLENLLGEKLFAILREADQNLGIFFANLAPNKRYRFTVEEVESLNILS